MAASSPGDKGGAGRRPLTIDVHSHFVPRAYLDQVRRDGGRFSASLTSDAKGRDVLTVKGRSYGVVTAQKYDLDVRTADMDARGIDMAVISPSPYLFYYWAPLQMTQDLCRLVNDAAAEIVAAMPRRFRGMAMVPLQSPPEAMRELERAKGLGLSGVEIGALIDGHELDDPAFLPFFEAAAALEMPVFLHPQNVGVPDRMDRYYLVNVIGNPLDTTFAVSRLIYGGVLERVPRLKVVLAHAGGFIPWLVGRMDHGFRVRPEGREFITRRPSDYARTLYYDTIAHFPDGVRFLAETMGSDHLVMGSDYPYDMGDEDPVKTITGNPALSADEKADALGRVAARLYGIS